MDIGVSYLGDDRCCFRVWAPQRQAVAVQFSEPDGRLILLERGERGYWQATVEQVAPGSRYQYQLNEDLVRPDPASHYQPDGVHGPSQVVDHSDFAWDEAGWQGMPLEQYVCYELHVGTFTPEGTFAAIIPRLKDLKELGITAIELMPVAQFPGDRNWGYDGVYPFAVQQSYGGPEGLKELVNACHRHGLAVILDVVYNHFGPEGNYTQDFGPYFTDTYRTPWGSAINFDAADSDGVRQFVIANVLHWLQHYHIDALRLDAVHAIYDFGAKHILAEMAEAVAEFSQAQGRAAYLIAESDLNDVRLLHPAEQGGYGLQAQWSDDFHHCLHTLLTKERTGYYQDFGQCAQLAKLWRQGYAYTWDYSPFRRRYHGSAAGDRPAHQFVVCAQNHDQVGNRMLGERLSQLVSFEALKLAAGAVLLSPYIPMLFMGEEYGETAPFLYFISHSDPELIEAVRQGRKREFADFHSLGTPPDAQSKDTFRQCILNWDQRQTGQHQVLWRLYQNLLSLRRDMPLLTESDRTHIHTTVQEADPLLVYHRKNDASQILCLFNFGSEVATITADLPPGSWQKRLDSAAADWAGTGDSLPQTLHLSQQANQEAIAMPGHSFTLFT